MPSRSKARPSPTGPYLAASDGRALVDVERSDAGLAQAFIAGDRCAPREIWDRYSPMVRRLLRRMLQPAWDLEDVVQDVFTALFSRLHQLRDPSALRSYLIGMTIRVARVEQRRRRVRRLLQFEAGPVERAAQVLPYRSEAAECLERVLSKVGDEARTLFVLRYVEELQIDEMASALAISATTVKRRLARANSKVFALARDVPALAHLVQESSFGGTTDERE